MADKYGVIVENDKGQDVVHKIESEKMKHFCQMYRQEIVVGCIALLVFGNSIAGEFAYDDRGAIIDNLDVSSADHGLREIFSHDFWGAHMSTKMSHKSYRPICVLSFRLNFLVHGFSVYGYHLINILLHALTSALVVRLARDLDLTSSASLVSGLFFAVHPVHSDAVAAVVGRADLLCTCFSLAALRMYLQSLRRREVLGKYYLLSLAYVTTATLSKELGLTFLGVFVVLECSHVSAGRQSFRAIVRCLGLVFYALVFMTYRLSLHGQHMLYPWTLLENYLIFLPTPARVYTTVYTHALYLFKIVYPHVLTYDYGFQSISKIDSIWDFRNALSVLAYSIVLAVVREAPIVLSALAILPFVPTANVLFPIGTVLAERLLYLPSVGICLLCGHVFMRLSKTTSPLRGSVRLVCFGLALIWSLQSGLRNHEW